MGTFVWRRRNLYNLSYQAQEQDVPRVHPLNRLQVHGKGPRNGEVICHRKVQQSFLNQSLDTPAPLPITSGLVSYAFSDFRALKGKTILTGASCLSDTCCLGQYLLNQYLLMIPFSRCITYKIHLVWFLSCFLLLWYFLGFSDWFYSYTLFWSIRVYFIRLSRLKFAKF